MRLTDILAGKTQAPCPSVHAPPAVAERALWTCAESATEMAMFALLLCVGLLVAAQLFLVWLTLATRPRY